MRSIEKIRDTGAAWVTEAELAMLCAFAKRAETSEMEVARLTLAEAKLAKVVGVLSAVSLHDDTESICLRALAAAKGEPCQCGGPNVCSCNPDTCTCSRCWDAEKGE